MLHRRVFNVVLIHLVALVTDGQAMTGSASPMTRELGSSVKMHWRTNTTLEGSDMVIFKHNSSDFASLILKRTSFKVYENSSFKGRMYHDRPNANSWGFKFNDTRMRDAGVYTCVYSNGDRWDTHQDVITLLVYDSTLTYMTEVVSTGFDLNSMETAEPTVTTLSVTGAMSAGKSNGKVSIAVTVTTGITSVVVTLVLTGLAFMFANKRKRIKQSSDTDILETLPQQTLEQTSDAKILSNSSHSIYEQVRESKMDASLKDFHPELPPRDVIYSQPFEDATLDSSQLGISCGDRRVHNATSRHQATYVDMTGHYKTKKSQNKMQDVYLTTKADVTYYNMGDDVTELKDKPMENIM